MNKPTAIGVIILVIIGIGIVTAAVSMDSSVDDTGSISEEVVVEETEEVVVEETEEVVVEETEEVVVEETEEVVVEEGRNLSVEFTESINLKTP